MQATRTHEIETECGKVILIVDFTRLPSHNDISLISYSLMAITVMFLWSP